MNVISLENIDMTFTTFGKSKVIFKGLNIAFNHPGLYAIEGPSGSGKSTLLKLIEGFIKPTNGQVVVNGDNIYKFSFKDLLEYRQKVCSIILQEYPVVGCFNAIDNICLPLFNSDDHIDKRVIYKKVCDLLDKYAPDIDKKIPCYKLSGGQQQRVCILRSLMMKSKIILADEPTGSLDEESAKKVMSLLREVSKTTIILVVTHNHELATKYADEIYYLKGGRLNVLPS